MDGVCFFDKVLWLKSGVGMDVDEPRPIDGAVWSKELQNWVCFELIMGCLRVIVEGEKSAVKQEVIVEGHQADGVASFVESQNLSDEWRVVCNAVGLIEPLAGGFKE